MSDPVKARAGARTLPEADPVPASGAATGSDAVPGSGSETGSGRETYRRLLGYVKPYWRMYALSIAGMALDGEIAIESEENQGTRVIVHLPRAERSVRLLGAPESEPVIDLD